MGKLSPRQRKLSEVTSLARQRLNSGCLSHRSLLNLNRNDPPSLCLHVAISLPSYPWWPQWSPREMYRDSQGLWRCHCGRVGLQVWAGCLGSHLQCLCLLFCSSGCRTMGLPARLLHAPRSLLSGQVEVAAWARSRENVGGAQRLPWRQSKGKATQDLEETQICPSLAAVQIQGQRPTAPCPGLLWYLLIPPRLNTTGRLSVSVLLIATFLTVAHSRCSLNSQGFTLPRLASSSLCSRG